MHLDENVSTCEMGIGHDTDLNPLLSSYDLKGLRRIVLDERL